MSMIVSLLRLFSPTAYAQLDSWGSSNPGVVSMWTKITGVLYDCGNVTGGCDVPNAIAGQITRAVGSVIFLIAVFMILYAGVRLVYSQGKEDALSEAKSIIMYALIGVLLFVIGAAVFAYLRIFIVTLFV